MARALTPDSYLAAVQAGGFESWPALPFWETISHLDTQLFDIENDTSPRAVRNAFIGKFVDSVADMARPAITSAMIERGLEWQASDAAWDALANSDVSIDLRDDYPALQSRFEGLAAVFLRSARQLATRMWDPAVQSIGAVTHVRLLGDMHLRGAVALLYINDRPALVYKPRSLAVDLLFQRVLERIGVEIAPTPVPRHPHSVDRGDHGFQEYLTYSSPAYGDQRTSFYKQYGVLVALAYALKFNDLHRENLLATENGPIVLDSECILNFGVSEHHDVHSAEHVLFRAQPTVLESQILPNWRMTFSSTSPYEVTALGNYAHPDRVPPVRRVLIDEGAPRYVYEPRTELEPTPHQPRAEEGIFPAAAHTADIMDGFDAAYRAILIPEVQQDILRLAQDAAQGRTRLVTVDTVAYGALLQSARGPATTVRTGLSVLQEALVDGERLALNHGVVPLFERNLGDGKILLDDGTSIETSSSPIAALQTHLRSLSSSDHASQRAVVEKSLALGAYNPSSGPPPTISLPVTADISQRIGDLVRKISGSVFGENGRAWSLRSDEVRTNYFTLQSAPPGLYTGTIGMAFSLGIAGLSHGSARHASSRLLSIFQRAIDDTAQRHLDSGDAHATALTGPGYLGPLLAIASLAHLQDDRDALKWVADVGRITAAAEQSPTGYDLIAGASGRIIAFARLFELTGDQSFRSQMRRAVEELVDRLPELIAKGRPPVGFAHGLSGIAMALHTAADQLSDVDLIGTAQLCLDLEDSLIASGQDDEKGSSWTWCWGATGQLTTRLVCSPESPRMGELHNAILQSESTYQGICHGVAGPGLLIRSPRYRDHFGDQRLSSLISKRLLREPTARVGAPAFAPDHSLYTGDAGVLIALCGLRDGATFSIHDLQYEPCNS